jgi:hypothetical protein
LGKTDELPWVFYAPASRGMTFTVAARAPALIIGLS